MLCLFYCRSRPEMFCPPVHVQDSLKQGCGVATQISGSSSRHLIFGSWSRTIWSIVKEKPVHCICTTLFLHKLYLWNWNPNLRLKNCWKKLLTPNVKRALMWWWYGVHPSRAIAVQHCWGPDGVVNGYLDACRKVRVRKNALRQPPGGSRH